MLGVRETDEILLLDQKSVDSLFIKANTIGIVIFMWLPMHHYRVMRVDDLVSVAYKTWKRGCVTEDVYEMMCTRGYVKEMCK